MAADFLTVDQSKPLGVRLLRAASQLRQVQQAIDELNDIAGHSFAGGDYTVLETNFGLTTGQGANAVTLLGLINTILNTNTDVTGATRQSTLDEFVARLGGRG